MDVSGAAGQIVEVSNKINEYYMTIKKVYNKYADKINSYIDELEPVINKLIESGYNAAKWAEFQLNKIIKKITDALEALKDKIDAVIQQVKVWYDKTINRLKSSIIKSVFAKLGQSLNDDAAASMSSMIPHPPIESLLPEIKIELQLPEVSNYLNYNGIDSINLTKLPLL